MKTFIAVLALAIACAASSCCKEKRCWQCINTINTTPNGVMKQDQQSKPYPVCDKTENEIRQYEQDSSTVVHCGIVTITTTVNCK